MIYKPKQKEFESILGLKIDKRIKHFKNMVGGHCYFWTCLDGENLLAAYDKDGNESIMVWPAKEYGEYFFNINSTTTEKRNDGINHLHTLEIHTFLQEYIDELSRKQIGIMVFPLEDGGALFTPTDFRNMIEEELAKYGDYDEEQED